MEEKNKIYIPKSVNSIFLKDMERFEIFKKDGSLNKNEFYNTLIMNYYQSYQESQSRLFDDIKETVIAKAGCSISLANDIASDILLSFDERTFHLDDQKLDVTLSMKPTARSAATIDLIQDHYVKGTTLSAYFRNMFASYSLLPQDKRERIIFKQNFDLVEEAIAQGKRIYFTTTGKDTPHIASPYSICNSKEELFNYLLAQYNDLPYSFRMGRIRNVTILNEAASVSDRNIAVFKRMEKGGPQFAYDLKEHPDEIIVRLSERGQKMYRSMYLHRPAYTKIDGDLYHFDCSLQQAYQYFSRFGRNAMVMSPKELAGDLHRFHAMAAREYRKIYGK